MTGLLEAKMFKDPSTDKLCILQRIIIQSDLLVITLSDVIKEIKMSTKMFSIYKIQY